MLYMQENVESTLAKHARTYTRRKHARMHRHTCMRHNAYQSDSSVHTRQPTLVNITNYILFRL